MQRRVHPVTPFLAPLFVLAAPSGEAAAKERQDAVNALDMDCSFDSFDANRFELLDGLNDEDRVAIEPAYDSGDGRVKSDDSDGWIRARRGEGAGAAVAAATAVGDGGWLSGLSAALLTPTQRVGVDDLCGSEEEEEEDGEGEEEEEEKEEEEEEGSEEDEAEDDQAGDKDT
jgi:hypothetical protein